MSNPIGHRFPIPQQSITKMDVAGDVLLSGKDEELKEEQGMKDNKLKFKKGKSLSEITNKIMLATLF